MTRVHAQKPRPKMPFKNSISGIEKLQDFYLWTESLRNLRYMQTSSPSMFGHAARHRCFSLLHQGEKNDGMVSMLKYFFYFFFFGVLDP
jgi:hypothetical protein